MILSLLFTIFIATAQDETSFFKIFKTEKPMIAALMIEKDLGSVEKVDQAIAWGKAQIKIAEDSGMDGILFEFRGGEILEPKITDSQFQNMLKISKALVGQTKKLIVGVEILWHYPEETLRLAKESGAAFVRIDFFADEVIADKKKVPIAPEKIIVYKNKIGADNVLLLTDIQVKYSTMVDPKITLEQSAQKAREKGSEGIIVTATKSGEAPNSERPRLAKKGAGALPVIIGSGFSFENAPTLLQYADGAIVGTSISEKTGGPLVAGKASQLMAVVKKLRKTYPPQWWAEITDPKKPNWEILPQEVKPPEVILSKRNELGILSNFASTPFLFKGKTYGSIEGFWQATKYPEGPDDKRFGLTKWPHTRRDVEKMDGFTAKRAGDFATKVMKKNNIDWVTFNGEQMKYKQEGDSPFYHLIKEATLAKLKQNQKVHDVLVSTGNLILRPDHKSPNDKLRAWRYYDIYTEFREKIWRGEPL